MCHAAVDVQCIVFIRECAVICVHGFVDPTQGLLWGTPSQLMFTFELLEPTDSTVFRLGTYQWNLQVWVCATSAFLVTPKLFSKVILPFCTPLHIIWAFQCQFISQILAIVGLSVFIQPKRHLLGVLCHGSVVTAEVEHACGGLLIAFALWNVHLFVSGSYFPTWLGSFKKGAVDL